MDDCVASTIDTYESAAEQYRTRNADRSVVEEFVDQFISALAGNRVLDIGCGPGWESTAFSEHGFDTVGIDLTPAFLQMIQDTAPSVSVARMDMRRLGFADESMDGLWACASFLHVPRSDAQSTLREFQRVLRSDGTLALAVKQGEGEQTGSVYESDERQFVFYTLDDLNERLRNAGFTVDDSSVTTDGWLQFIAKA
ncbi:class I SAM-dependent methyltransferase [Halocatena marina]|uniref:Class I SAM-dependent methyltransferase n=1 Tax=Halocatena marina TaxID=2934937 RepID=A0ABD5YKK0_9EURY|nr:class I SAM-dependent methyltransferase [Halocatena marina]